MLKEFQLELKKLLPQRGRLAKAINYSVFAGGKLFRPQLCFTTAKALGKSPKQVFSIAAAIEMLHTFTLIHDDLPGMDNSDYRRGKLSCHRKFDEATAILAGDALNSLAFEVLAQADCSQKVVEVIAKAINKVIEGQVLDLESEGEKIGLAKLKIIHSKKTAALLIASVKAVALRLKARPKQVKALEQYALHLGLAFQITDDILDATSSQKEIGKPVKADQKKGFPYVVGLEKSKKLAVWERDKAISFISCFDSKADSLRSIAKFVVTRKK